MMRASNQAIALNMGLVIVLELIKLVGVRLCYHNHEWHVRPLLACWTKFSNQGAARFYTGIQLNDHNLLVDPLAEIGL